MSTAELLIFNLDGTIVDVSQSVPSAIRRTVQNYFSHFLGIHGSGSLVKNNDVQLFWGAGLNDPQELSAALIAYLLSLLPETFYASRPPSNINEAVGFLKKTSQSVRHISSEYLQKQANLPDIAARIQAAGGGTLGLKKVMKGHLKHPLLMDQGPIDKSNLVGRLFLEIYLGKKNLYRVERLRPRFHRQAGLIESETLLIDQKMLQTLRHKYRARMALVTTRRQANLELITKGHQIDHLFDAIITRENMVSEAARLRRLGKSAHVAMPHPFMLLDAAEYLDYQGTQTALYIGNTPNGMRAAQAADAESKRTFLAWGLVPSGAKQAALKQELIIAGAQQLFDDPTTLMTQLLG